MDEAKRAAEAAAARKIEAQAEESLAERRRSCMRERRFRLQFPFY